MENGCIVRNEDSSRIILRIILAAYHTAWPLMTVLTSQSYPVTPRWRFVYPVLPVNSGNGAMTPFAFAFYTDYAP